jgi:hypothetical protein
MTGSELGDRIVVARFYSREESLDCSIFEKVGVRTSVLDAANVFGAALENMAVSLTKAIHFLPAKRRRVEVPQVDLRDIVVERH